MQEAGRILLMPKGDYSASATYEMLDLVNHSGASWVCKKDCTGQEPSDSNTEFWQRFGTAVDLSNYFPKSGGTIDGNVFLTSLLNELRVFVVNNSLRQVNVEVQQGGAFRLRDTTNSKDIINSTADGTSTFNGTASGNIKLTDKPTGTYTGTGASNTISVGGIGKVVLIRNTSNYNIAFVTTGGYIGKQGENVVCGTNASLNESAMSMTLAANSTFLNESGTKYTYQVL